ncbi:MAG: FIST C-terminal domain-containing protein [Burkholderiales bacterium]|nr:FIST C-terminal domain-containing protein [Anaerolineae bacterium]
MSGSMYLPDAHVSTLVAQIKKLDHKENDTILLLVAEHSTFDLQALLTALKEQDVPVAGGVFPGIIYGNCKYDAGIVAHVLPVMAKASVITGLENSDFQLDHLPDFPDKQQYTALVLVDGLTKHVALFLDRLFRHLGNTTRYIGGGAGSLSFVQKPCVFDSEGIYQDAALVLWLKTTVGLGVRHGWKRLRGPFVATNTDGPVVQKLGNQPAFQVYSQIVNMVSGKTLTKENFFSIAKEYPLGIYHPGMDYIVRDPITFTDEGALVCVGEVPARSMIYILRGEKKSLIDNAHLATSEAMSDALSQAGNHNLIVDCISRVLYLEHEFSKELDAVVAALPEGASTPFGMLSLGEIATFKTGRVEFFNKTFVVGALQDIPSPLAVPPTP